ncbi:hypothetical protein SAMN06264365_111161 [Actinoplanes regularis]|uniref:Uncharacterized protein n=1 Tax=Actinoplanes regularis TaxID=52697 RepID=A0A239CGH9_9ACTN|nr:hypothetical protein Are01nite_58880 [Actinoplanes regularis]SNS18982.1 hypothetical protein SAMN06264365_111161 [Actinoplanes regularis]
MTEKREYSPAVLVHSESCPDAISLRARGVGLIPMATPAIAQAYPNGRMHNCFHFTLQARGLVETVQYPPHAYEESSVIYPNASMPLCAVCMGTHSALDRLILPPGVR